MCIRDRLKLYNLIARRFLATLMGPATIENMGAQLVKEVATKTNDCLLYTSDVYKRQVSAPVFAESELDATVATWKFKGASHKISAREAIESQYSLCLLYTSRCV